MQPTFPPAKSTIFSKKKTLNCNGKLLELDKPLVMGILNLSPDSFYQPDDKDLMDDPYWFKGIVEKMSLDADIIDIGAVSTRPGAVEVSVEEELERLIPFLENVVRVFPDQIFSVDTYRAKVAEAAVGAGASMINDISGGTIDPLMFTTIAKLKVPYVLMHIQGTPKTMQQHPQYEDVIKEVMQFMAERISKLHDLGVVDIILDPGFGFGKTVKHNFQLMKQLEEFCIFDLPLLVGISRKSMIQKVLGIRATEAMNGTSILNTIALMKGADILRVHDVRQAREAVKLFEAIKQA
jgi:dihydropteroate synthase